MAEKEDTIYTMELHSVLFRDKLKIIKVPGGWIYHSYNERKNQYNNEGVFVPFK